MARRKRLVVEEPEVTARDLIEPGIKAALTSAVKQLQRLEQRAQERALTNIETAEVNKLTNVLVGAVKALESMASNDADVDIDHMLGVLQAERRGKWKSPH